MIDTLKTVLSNIIGQYTPISYVNENGIDVIPDGLSGVDFGYLISGLLLVVCIYGIVRIIGGLIRNV